MTMQTPTGDPNEMVVVAFPDEGKAEQALKVLRQLKNDQAVVLGNAAVIVRSKANHIAITETHDFNAKQGAIAGALAGGLVGLLKGNLLAGAALGGASGALASKVVDLGFPDAMLRQIGEQLTPGSSALVAVVHFAQVDEAMAVLDQFDSARILRHTLPADIAQKLAAVVEDAPRA